MFLTCCVVRYPLCHETQADSKSSKASSSKAAKRGKSRYSSSYSSSYSMSYGPPPTPPVLPTVLPTPNPTRSTPPPTTRSPTAQPTGTCCNPDDLRQTILDKVYDGNDSIFDGGPAKEAMAWLISDACDCGQFCSEDQVVQRYILAVLYFSTDGNNWDSCSAPDNIQNDDICEVLSRYGNNIIIGDDGKTFSSGFKWLTCNNECEWGGINCNEKNGLVNATDVEDNGLTGFLPFEVAALPRLSAFALEQNDISGTIPSTYSDLARLVILDLDFNSLEGSLEELDLGKLKKLRQLDLNNNNLVGTLGDLGWEETSLQFLDLSYNNFEGPIPAQIGNLPNGTLCEFYRYVLLPEGRFFIVTRVSLTIITPLFSYISVSAQLFCNQLDAPLDWDNCPTNTMVADDYICDDSSCECTAEYNATKCSAKLASNKSG
eukprot:scaffold1926_cov83-Skeletonema_dohrnii-CCMP3373.AAC.2